MTDKEITKDITIAMIEKLSFVPRDIHNTADQAADMNAQMIAKIYKTIYDAVNNASN